MRHLMFAVWVGLFLGIGTTSVWADEPDQSGGPTYSLGANPPTVQPKDTLKIGIKGRLWLADFEGDVRAEENSIVGTRIDTDSVLDMDPRQEVPEGEVYFHLSDTHRINFHFWSAEFDGRQILVGDITFAGSSYTAGTTVESSLSIDMFTFTYEYIVPISDMTGTTVGLQIGAKYIDFTGEIDAIDSPIPFGEKERFQAPVPVIGARFRVEFNEWIAAEVQGNGFVISGMRDVKATWYDLVAELDVTPWGGLYGGIGYHLFHVDVEDESSSNDEFELDVDIGGFFFAAGYRF